MSDLTLTDDIALFGNTGEQYQRATDEFAARGAKAGLPINVKTTKTMHVKNKHENINMDVLGSEQQENVADFTYLGSTPSYNGSH